MLAHAVRCARLAGFNSAVAFLLLTSFAGTALPPRAVVYGVRDDAGKRAGRELNYANASLPLGVLYFNSTDAASLVASAPRRSGPGGS